jgi:kynurenine formamidase
VKVVDLTLEISASLKVFPGSPQPCFLPWTNFSMHGYDSEAIFMSTHTGTHVDAPSHFVPGRSSIERIPADRFVADAVLVRIPKKANELVEARDFKDIAIRENDAVIISTGWEKKIRSKSYMTENPGLSAGAARFLASRKVSMVGIDGPSIDAGSDARFTAHRVLLAKNVLAVENLCNLRAINMDRFMLVVAPLKLRGATGSPVRALAIL